MLISAKGNQDKIYKDYLWYKFDALGYEGAAEVVCSHILRNSNVTDFVGYSPTGLDNRRACCSLDFSKKDSDIITVARLIKAVTGKSCKSALEDKSVKEQIKFVVDLVAVDGFAEYLTAMLEFDALVLNEDRHLDNITLYRDSKGVLSLASVFDNGAAFLSDTTRKYPMNKNVYDLITTVESKPFNTNFNRQVDVCRELYGSQLRIKKDLWIEEPLYVLRGYYHDNVISRISDIYEHQKYLWSELFVDDMNTDREFIYKCIPEASREQYGNTKEEQIDNFIKEHPELL